MIQKLKIINKAELPDYINNLKIDYEQYSKWVIDEIQVTKFFIVSTSNIEIRPQKFWNTEGRELYDIIRLKEHSQKVNYIINELGLKLFLIQHGYENSIWFPEMFENKEQVIKKLSFFKNNQAEFDFNKFDGGFLTDNKINEFIDGFIDYPYIFKYNDIECLSMEAELIIRITHHLTVDFITPHQDINYKLIETCKNINLSFVNNFC